MIQNEFPEGAEHDSASSQPAVAEPAAVPPSPATETQAGAPVKATVVDPASAAGAVVVPAKAVLVRSSKASSVTSQDSSVYQDTELLFDFGRYVGGVDPLTGLRHGHGTLTYNNGNVYDGEWRQGAPEGIGEKRYANGDVYRGGWRQGERQGRGGYLFAAGHYFEGMYDKDTPSGYGILTTVNGDRYAGHWKDGKKDGKGRETLADGQTFIGHWKQGKKQGRGKLLLSGADCALYGIWHEDHFFRELTEEEMGKDGSEDIVDEFGLPRGVQDASTEQAAGNPFDLHSISQRLQKQWMTGVSAMEQRLDALSHALDNVTSGTAAGDAAIVNSPAVGVSAGPARASAAAHTVGSRPPTQTPVTAAVAGTVESDVSGVADSAAGATGSAAAIDLDKDEDGNARILSTADKDTASS